MHEAFIVPGLVDGAVVHKQAQERAADKRHPGSTLVHAHRSGVPCKGECKVYLAARYAEDDES